MYDPWDFDEDTAAIGRIFLAGLRAWTFFAAIGWLLKAAETGDNALADLGPNTGPEGAPRA